MQIGRITSKVEGDVVVHGKSQGYIGLPVRHSKEVDPTTNKEAHCMEMAFLPTIEDMHRLIAGEPIILTLLHMSLPPPMRMRVGDD